MVGADAYLSNIMNLELSTPFLDRSAASHTAQYGRRYSSRRCVVWHRPDPPRNLAGARQRRGWGSTAGPCRADISALSRMRNSRAWFCSRLLRRVPARFPDRVLLQMSGRVPLLQHPAHGRNRGAPGRSRLPAATGAAVGARRTQTATLLPSARRQWPLYSGKPTLATEGSRHRTWHSFDRHPRILTGSNQSIAAVALESRYVH